MINLDLLPTSNNLQGNFTYILMKYHILLQTDFWKVLVANLWNFITKAWKIQQQSSQNIYYTQTLCYIIWANSWCIVNVPTQQTSYTADDSRNFAEFNTFY